VLFKLECDFLGNSGSLDLSDRFVVPDFCVCRYNLEFAIRFDPDHFTLHGKKFGHAQTCLILSLAHHNRFLGIPLLPLENPVILQKSPTLLDFFGAGFAFH
jgi:hypothetical protein